MLSFGDTIIDQEQREILEHGTNEFPIACYYDNLKKKFNPWHWHEEYEVGIVREKSVMIKTPNVEYRLEEGDGFFINSGVLHAVQNCDAKESIVDSLVFHGSLVGGALGSLFWEKYILPVQSNAELPAICFRKGEVEKAVEIIESAWMECVDGEYGFEVNVRFLLSNLFLLIHHENRKTMQCKTAEESDKIKRIKVMTTYINESFQDKITLQDIADSAMVSKSECMRCFRSVLKISPIVYLNRCRLEYAASLLLSTSWKVSYVCQKCGFQDMSYFSKVFKRMYHCTPSEYRLTPREISSAKTTKTQQNIDLNYMDLCDKI